MTAPEVQRDRELIRQALEEAGSCAISHVERVQNKLRPLPVEPKTVTAPRTGRTWFLNDEIGEIRSVDGMDWFYADDIRALASLLPPSTDTQEETTRRYTVDEICAKAGPILRKYYTTQREVRLQSREDDLRSALEWAFGDSTP